LFGGLSNDTVNNQLEMGKEARLLMVTTGDPLFLFWAWDSVRESDEQVLSANFRSWHPCLDIRA